MGNNKMPPAFGGGIELLQSCMALAGDDAQRQIVAEAIAAMDALREACRSSSEETRHALYLARWAITAREAEALEAAGFTLPYWE